MPGKQLASKKRATRRYGVDQCAFYKLESKARLYFLLGVNRETVSALLQDKESYRTFEQPESVCEFTGKLTKARWVQEPLGLLKVIQSRITKLLGRVSLPDYCHGATTGRSYRTNGAAHSNAQVAATFDIKAFFPSTSKSKVYNFFRVDLHCSHDVSEILSDLVCKEGVLPTGAPSSPIVSFYANRQLFAELNQIACDRGLVFTVYMDDLTFSGESISSSLKVVVKLTVEKHGHRLSQHKTKVFGPNVVKHITGTVIHEGQVTAPHSRFKKARAIAKVRSVAVEPKRRLDLSRKLAGLLGEAAYLDKRYCALAKRSYEMLADDTIAADTNAR
jgi:RNA-directed DNA polymerase